MMSVDCMGHVISVLEEALIDQTAPAIVGLAAAVAAHSGDDEAMREATEAAAMEVGEVVLNLSNDRGFGDAMAVALAQGVGELLARRPELRGALTELWLHHTVVGDNGLGSAGAGGTAMASLLLSGG